MSTVILTVTGLILAFLLDNFAKSKLVAGVTRTLLFMPMMMSLVAVGLLWSLIYNPTLGIITNLIAQLHLFGNAAPFDFLGSQKTAIYAAFVPAIWQWSGFGMVVFSAAILNIPGELKEAATVDGANKFKIMLNIELPLIMPTIIVVSTVNLIGGFKAFDLVYVMTAGGPGSSTMVTAIYMFIQAFKNMNLGYASAIAILLFILTVVFAMLTTRLTSLLNKKAGY
jgi:raffinose/stachyose/melibiose transport system permease protein